MKNLITKIAVGMGVALVAATVSATPINITVNSSGALINGVGVAPAPGSNNPSDNLNFLNQEIANWNGVPLSPNLPSAGSLALDQGSLGGASNYTGPSGYQYVVFHFGRGQAGGGKDGTDWQSAYYLNGQSISFTTLPQINGQSVGGFSSARYFGTVNTPDGGATAAMMGAALAAVGFIRRKFIA